MKKVYKDVFIFLVWWGRGMIKKNHCRITCTYLNQLGIERLGMQPV